MLLAPFEPGDILFLERSIAGIPWPSGYYVLQAITEGTATVALVSQDAQGLYGIDNPYTISVEDLGAFSPTGQKGRVTK